MQQVLFNAAAALLVMQWSPVTCAASTGNVETWIFALEHHDA